MIFYSGDGSEVDVNFDTLKISIDGEAFRDMTEEEIVFYAPLKPINPLDLTLEAKLESALSVLRDSVADSNITDEELATATPKVLAALELFSSYGEWDDKLGMEAIKIISRICHAILVRAEAQSIQAKTVMQQLSNGVAGLTQTILAHNQRITALEEANG